MCDNRIWIRTIFTYYCNTYNAAIYWRSLIWKKNYLYYCGTTYNLRWLGNYLRLDSSPNTYTKIVLAEENIWMQFSSLEAYGKSFSNPFLCVVLLNFFPIWKWNRWEKESEREKKEISCLGFWNLHTHKDDKHQSRKQKVYCTQLW